MTRKKERQINLLAAAIHRQIEWRQNMMQLKQEMKIKRMLLACKNRKRRLSNQFPF